MPSVRSRAGKELPHKRVGEQGEMPELHVDGCASEECEIVYVKEACLVHEGGGYSTR